MTVHRCDLTSGRGAFVDDVYDDDDGIVKYMFKDNMVHDDVRVCGYLVSFCVTKAIHKRNKMLTKALHITFMTFIVSLKIKKKVKSRVETIGTPKY